MKRRDFLRTSAAFTALGLGTSSAWATTQNTSMKFVFVFAQGGWDPTRVFADGFDISGVSMEAGASRAEIGGVSFIDHPSRPSVAQFFSQYYNQTLVVNGLLVPSIAHEICTMLAMTGTSQGTAPDWASILGEHQRDQYTLPSLVVGGPSFPGPYVEAVARTGVQQQLDNLISGQALTRSDVPVTPLRAPSERIIDRYMLRRAAAEAFNAQTHQAQRLADGYQASLEKLTDLKDLQFVMDFTGGASMDAQSDVAVDALSMGISRVVTLSAPGNWDTHGNNDALQSPLWENTFAGLGLLMEKLARTPGETMTSLAEETTVVVLSEMGRTPGLNAQNGKDHHPITSCMLLGPTITGNRTIGGYDSNFFGQKINPETAELSATGQTLSAEALGATLLYLGGIDPAQYVRGVSPILGLLR